MITNYTHLLEQYGNGVIVDKRIIKRILFIIAVLPCGTAWVFGIIRFIKDIKIRW